MNTQKQMLRDRLRKVMGDIDQLQRRLKSQRACRNLLATPQFKDAAAVMVYLAMPDELDTCQVIHEAWKLGKIIAVPKILWRRRSMIPVRIDSLDTGFSVDVTGLKNPIAAIPFPVERIDLVIAPALAYDGKGNRLGRGGSYYDKFFGDRKLKAARCGFAYRQQLVETVPVVEKDQPVHMLVTDDGVKYFDRYDCRGGC